MMTAAPLPTPDAPDLSLAEIQRELERILAKDRRSMMVGVWGRGEEGAVQVGEKTYRVVPTRCEIELRTAMPEGAEDGHIVFLVDWTESLPLDLSSRLAGGVLFRPARDRRLAAVFGAKFVEAGLAQSALARLVLAGELAGIEGAVPGQVLRRADAYRRALQIVLGFPQDGPLTIERLCSWAMTDAGGPEFCARAGEPWEDFRSEIRTFVKDEGNALGLIAWKAWEAGQGRRLIELMLILEPLLSSWGRGTYAEGLLRGRISELAPSFGADLIDAAPDIAGQDAVTRLVSAAREAAERPFRAAVQAADRLIDDNAFRAGLEGSTWLPCGLEARSRQLADAVKALSADPTSEALSVVRNALAALEGHRLLDGESRERHQKRRMLAKLAGYLVQRLAAGVPPMARSLAEGAVELAEAYRLEGGWVDLARQRLRGFSDLGLGTAAQTLLARVDQIRRQDDREFSAGVVKWLEGGQQATRALPMSAASKKLIADFVSGKEHRKLLVLVIDGMSWANAVELVPSLYRESGRWQPAAWRPKGFRSATDILLPPVIAVVPTLTKTSRATFFAGKDSTQFGNEPETKDVERWAANTVVRRVLGDDPEPRLLLKDAVIDCGNLHSTAADLIKSDDRIVAMVVNTIDDQLCGSPDVVVECTVDRVRPLGEILTLAEHSGRAVLLISDHGHVPGSGMSSRGPAKDGGRRWRPLRSGDAPQDFEVALPEELAWRLPGTKGVAAVVDDSVCYGQPNAGEHGGASLAEVVAPAVLLVYENLADETGDAELAAVRFPQPDWWAVRPPKVTPLPVKVTTGKPPREGVQTSFLGKPAVVAGEETAHVEPAVVAGLRGSTVFKAHTAAIPKERVAEALKRLQVLVEAGGQLDEYEFARRSGLQPYRVAGAVARMMEVFNLDGYAVVQHNALGRQVVVDMSQLRQLFEVSG
ncbi:MAG TPA: BREX-2 system phosphatase PglZ [Polyangiaceae bacterium]|nr:BREX-2 system phosphatase PglZ [Polyangiaceae bacterium]